MQGRPSRFETPAEAEARAREPITGGGVPTVFAPEAGRGGPVNAGNDSGTGSSAKLPAELKGFSWAAFLMNWVWALAHSTGIGLLSLILPFPLLQITLGVKGNEWAWQNRRWDSIEQFRATQKVWLWWGIARCIVTVLVLGGIAYYLYAAFYGYVASLKDFKLDVPTE